MKTILDIWVVVFRVGLILWGGNILGSELTKWYYYLSMVMPVDQLHLSILSVVIGISVVVFVVFDIILHQRGTGTNNEKSENKP